MAYPQLEMTFGEDWPALDPVISYEVTDYGWRGLTACGEVLEVRSTNGAAKAAVPPSILVNHKGKTLGRRAVSNAYPFCINEYMHHFDRAVVNFKNNHLDVALAGFETAINVAPTAAARFNLGLVMLALGHWPEGFGPYEARLELMTPPLCKDLPMPRWRGEPLKGKRLLMVHDAGYGDTLMMLRYVPQLRACGADVYLRVPAELARLADQMAPVTSATDADYYCPMLSLLHLLDQSQGNIPNGPYLHVDWPLVTKWQACLPKTDRARIGIAWSVGCNVDGDYPRALPLGTMVAALPHADLFSVQVQGGEGVTSYQFEDFADCAALMHCMDEIVTVDTAAAHLAGATGHPCVTVMLSHWASWRWLDNPFYPEIRLCQQKSPGDWSSAFAEY